MSPREQARAIELLTQLRKLVGDLVDLEDLDDNRADVVNQVDAFLAHDDTEYGR